MRTLKSFLVSILVVFMIPHVAYSDDGNTFYYYTKSSTTPTAISLDELDKLTFSNDGILLWKQDGGMNNILFDDFLLFTFSEIENPYVSVVVSPFIPQDLQINFLLNNRKLFVESRQLLDGIGVYDLQGRMLFNDKSTATKYIVNLPVAPKGIYVVKTMCNGKIIVKKIIL